MAQRAEPGGTSVREGTRALRREMSADRIEEKLNEVIAERPLAAHLLSWEVVIRAVIAAAVLTLVFLVLASAPVAAVVLVLGFFGSWFFFAARRYEKRRPTKPAE